MEVIATTLWRTRFIRSLNENIPTILRGRVSFARSAGGMRSKLVNGRSDGASNIRTVTSLKATHISHTQSLTSPLSSPPPLLSRLCGEVSILRFAPFRASIAIRGRRERGGRRTKHAATGVGGLRECEVERERGEGEGGREERVREEGVGE